jgi:uncharacterized protein
MEMVKDALNWFEIPASDFGRAAAFYSTIFDFEMPTHQMGPNMMGFFLHEQGKGVGGAIIAGEGYAPSKQGSLVYLNGGADLTAVLDRIEAAGGQVIMPKREVAPGLGYVALFVDCEGNRVGLHSMG